MGNKNATVAVPAMNAETFNKMIQDCKGKNYELKQKNLVELSKRIDNAKIPDTINNTDELRKVLKDVEFFENEIYYLVKCEAKGSENQKHQFIYPIIKNNQFVDVTSESMFQLFDLNHDKVIQKDELIHGLLVYASHNKEALSELSFNCCDFDGSKTLTLNEIQDMMHNNLKVTYAVLHVVMQETIKPLIQLICSKSFVIYQTQKQKEIQMNDLLSKFLNDCCAFIMKNEAQIVKEWMNLVDINHDNVITFDEFKKTFSSSFQKKFKQIINNLIQPLAAEFKQQLALLCK